MKLCLPRQMEEEVLRGIQGGFEFAARALLPGRIEPFSWDLFERRLLVLEVESADASTFQYDTLDCLAATTLHMSPLLDPEKRRQVAKSLR